MELAAQRFIKQQQLAAAKERAFDDVSAKLAAESRVATRTVAASVEDGLKTAVVLVRAWGGGRHGAVVSEGGARELRQR
jgi:hypothetical protein